MSLLRKLLATKQVRTPLEFGINEEVRLLKISNDVRKRDGEAIPRHMYMTFGKFNKKGELVANSEFNYFNFNPEYENVINNLFTEVSQLNNLVSIINPEAKFSPADDYEDLAEIQEAISTKKGCKSLQDSIWKAFNKAVKNSIGNESTPFNLKVITDYKTGKYLQLPSEGSIAENIGVDPSELSISPSEIRNMNKALVPTETSADGSGAKPPAKSPILDI